MGFQIYVLVKLSILYFFLILRLITQWQENEQNEPCLEILIIP